MFRFLVEEKIKCLATEKVKYTQRVDYIMQLPVPMDAALNKGSLLTQQGLGMNGSPDLKREHSRLGLILQLVSTVEIGGKVHETCLVGFGGVGKWE